MKSAAFLSFFISSVALANPSVYKNTDVSKRKAKEHYQVTRCVEGKCEVYEVTEFDKSIKMDGVYSRQCLFIVEDKKRFMACNREPQKPKVVTERVEVPVIQERKVFVDRVHTIQNKKNRFSLHLGGGPNGLSREETNEKTSVSENREPVFGFGYSRLVSDRASFGVNVFNNTSGFLTVGLDF